MPDDRPSPTDVFEVRCGAATICACCPGEHPTPGSVVAFLASWDAELGMIDGFDPARVEVWRGGTMVALAHRDEASGEYVIGPAFDPSRGMPPRVVEAFDRFFPGILDQ